jgi:hypothetical protein
VGPTTGKEQRRLGPAVAKAMANLSPGAATKPALAKIAPE